MSKQDELEYKQRIKGERRRIAFDVAIYGRTAFQHGVLMSFFQLGIIDVETWTRLRALCQTHDVRFKFSEQYNALQIAHRVEANRAWSLDETINLPDGMTFTRKGG